MGTHPIFESDFNCLTDLGLNNSKCQLLSSGQLLTSSTPRTSARPVSPGQRRPVTWRARSHSSTQPLSTQDASPLPPLPTVELFLPPLVTKTPTSLPPTLTPFIKKNSRATYKSIRNTVRA